jgi:hypothetical protein
MRFSRLPPTAREEIFEVARRRAETPTDKALAEKYGCSIAWIQALMIVWRRQLVRKPIVNVSLVPRGTQTLDNGALPTLSAPDA